MDEIGEAKMLHNEDKRAFALIEQEFGGHGNVQSEIGFSDGNQSVGGDSNVQVDVDLEVDERFVRLFLNIDVFHGDGERARINKEVIRRVEKGTSRQWAKLVGVVHDQVLKHEAERKKEVTFLAEEREGKPSE